MPDFEFQAFALVQLLEGGLVLTEPLLFDTLSRLMSRAPTNITESGLDALERQLRQFIKDMPSGELYRYRQGEPPWVDHLEIEIKPPARSTPWREPVRARFWYAGLRHGTEATNAYVPALQLTVLADNDDDLRDQLPRQIRHALIRLDAQRSLERLVRLGRCRELKQVELATRIHLPTLKHRSIAERQKSSEEDSVVGDLVDDLSGMQLAAGFELDAEVQGLAELLAQRPGSVLLVGPSGVGKTALLYELARRRRDFQWGSRPFWTTSGSRLVAGQSGFGMWQQQCQKLVEEATRKDAVVHFGNLVELIEVGKGGGSQQGIAALLRTPIQRGQLTAVIECTSEQLTVIEREEPQLLDALLRLELREPTIDRGRAILLSAATTPVRLPSKKRLATRPTLDAEGIEALDRLHRRYATYSAYPGRPLRFLENLLEDRTDQTTLSSADVMSAFSEETGLPRFLLDDQLPLDLEETRQWFAQRVVGQSEAVDVVTETVGAIKAGLTQSGRPIASFMFIGPTGVGKTEMAKALSAYMYRNAERMIRIDMSEYADSLAIDRLIGGSLSTQGILTAKVREQPFTVVLLDEFEKAHPAFFDLLLQVLGDGRLTDSAGRVADFRNAVVIMTSNLGTDTFKSAAFGFGSGQATAADADRNRTHDHFVARVREFVRPEFFNRLDRVITFQPLGEDVIQTIAERELKKVLGRDGLRYRNVEMTYDPTVTRELARLGYDPRYGARPLKRAIERFLVAPLARHLNRYSESVPLQAHVSETTQKPAADDAVTTTSGRRMTEAGVDEDDREAAELDKAAAAGVGARLRIEVRAHDISEVELARQQQSSILAAQQVTHTRRRAQSIAQCPAARALDNEIYRRKQTQLRSKRRRAPGKDARYYLGEGQLKQLRDLAAEIAGVLQSASALEDTVLMQVYQEQPVDHADVTRHSEELGRRMDRVAIELFLRDTRQADRVTMVIFGKDAEHRDRLVSTYAALALNRNCQLSRLLLTPTRANRQPGARFRMTVPAKQPDQRPEPVLDAVSLANPVAKQAEFLQRVVAEVLTVKGKAAFPLLAPEKGMHTFQDSVGNHLCVVDVCGEPPIKYVPHPRANRADFLTKEARHLFSLRRHYDCTAEKIQDPKLATNVSWDKTGFQPALTQLLLDHFQRRVSAITAP